ncbi:MAG: SGNH/GDSL hydrolase family protein [Actinobacteria bacterium]|nr:SGNH/GDSL hydrolase family protein [Actinomycetota bacterium]
MTLPRPALPRVLVVVTAVVALFVVPVGSDALAGDTETYVALGDSYTAGPGIPNPVPHPLGCWRSDRNYPHLVAQARGSLLRDASCSGATTTDLAAPQPVLGGPNPPQLDALDAEVGVASLQIGGNDIGFAEILQRCTAVVPLGTPCQRHYTTGGTDEISRRIADTAPKVAAVLAEARRRSPEARLFVLGYPSILPETRPGCWPVMPIAPGDVPYLREKHKELNAMLATPAEAARLNGLARAMLVADGTLCGRVVTVGGMALATGDRVVMGRRAQGPREPGEPGHGGVGFDIPPRSIGTVERVAIDGSWVEVDFASAGRARLATSSPQAEALCYAYATCEAPAPARGVVAELDRRLALSALEFPELELGR